MIVSLVRLGLFALVFAAGISMAYAGQAAVPAGQDQGAAAPSSDAEPRSPIPPLNDEDRAAAFPQVDGHATHDQRLFYYVLFDQLEWRGREEGEAIAWDNTGWIGGDIHRFWFRTEGEGERNGLREAEAHLLYGRAVSRWWDLVAGIRQDVRPGPAQTWAAFGIQGLAPYFFELRATGYVGASGRTQARLEAEYELLITNRLVLQPRAEINLASKADGPRNTGAGVLNTEAGLRLRYEFRREFAPYAGLAWSQKFGRTADFARAAGSETRWMAVTAGIRFWF